MLKESTENICIPSVMAKYRTSTFAPDRVRAGAALNRIFLSRGAESGIHSKTELAAAMDISPGMVSQHLSGESPMNLATVWRYCDILRIPDPREIANDKVRAELDVAERRSDRQKAELKGIYLVEPQPQILPRSARLVRLGVPKEVLAVDNIDGRHLHAILIDNQLVVVRTDMTTDISPYATCVVDLDGEVLEARVQHEDDGSSILIMPNENNRAVYISAERVSKGALTVLGVVWWRLNKSNICP